MKFVIAPDSFKGSLSSVQAAETIRKAILTEMPSAITDILPIADGGEGTVDAFLRGTGGKSIAVRVTGPLGEPVQAVYAGLADGETAVIEIAAAAGLTLVPAERRNPLPLTTYGVGECMRDALERGYRRLIVGLGGSATNDGGLGMLQALGVRFADARGAEVAPVAASLAAVRSVDFAGLDPRVREASLSVACDVDNPLCGERGASRVYGPQKGAAPGQIAALDEALAAYARRVEAALGGARLSDAPGAGAAGGLGFALLALGGAMSPGAELVAAAVGLEQRLHGGDWLITGEGKTDRQALNGKAPYYVAGLARRHGVRTLLVSGCLEDVDMLYPHFDSMHAVVSGPMTVEQSMADAERLLYDKMRNIVRLWR